MAKKKNIPVTLDRFNWGAFAFSWIWGIFNGLWWSAGIIVLMLMNSLATWTMTIAVCFLLGFKGNAISWRSKKWKSAKAFDKAQTIWSIVGIVILLIGLVNYVWWKISVFF